MIIENWILNVWLIQIGIPAAMISIFLVYTKIARVIAQVDEKHIVFSTTDKIKFALISLWLVIYHINVQWRYINSYSYLSEDFTPFIYMAILTVLIILYIAVTWTTKLVVSRGV